MKSGIQIANGNEKLYTMLSQANASQNSRQMIGNTHNGFQHFACIMTEKLDTLVPICVAKKLLSSSLISDIFIYIKLILLIYIFIIMN